MLYQIKINNNESDLSINASHFRSCSKIFDFRHLAAKQEESKPLLLFSLNVVKCIGEAVVACENARV